MKTFRGITGTKEIEPFKMGGRVQFLHGLDAGKIISVNVLVNSTTAGYNLVPDEHSPDGSSGWLYNIVVSADWVYIYIESC